MTDAQKVIKYLAIGFGIFLVVTIISAIVFGFNIIFGIFSGNTLSEELHSVEMTDDISSFEIDLGATNFTIKGGQEFKVETNNDKINVSEKDGRLIVKEKKRYSFFGSKGSELVITVPDQIYDSVKVDNGAGKVNIKDLNVKVLDLSLGAGVVSLNDVSVDDETIISGGAGEVKMENVLFNDLDLDLGVGKFYFYGRVLGSSEIDAGVGEVDLNFIDNDYRFNVKKGVGTIKIDGKEIHDGENYGDGKNVVNIDGGVGSIKVSMGNLETITESEEFTKVYKLLNITKASDAESYLTLQALEGEVETVLVKNIDAKLVAGKKYEFKFLKTKEFEDKIENIFENCEIISVEEVK